jgi:3-phosphoshikimate 1-carboxyvinyltransferase
MLRGFGYEVECENDVISLQGGGALKATSLDIPADISSAAFFWSPHPLLKALI